MSKGTGSSLTSVHLHIPKCWLSTGTLLELIPNGLVLAPNFSSKCSDLSQFLQLPIQHILFVTHIKHTQSPEDGGTCSFEMSEH